MSGSNGAGPLIAVEDLVVHYPVARGLVGSVARRPQQVVRAVEGVSFTVARGELVALVGESGCGKTTTAQAVLRLVEPVSGRIEFDGDDITGLQSRALRPLRRRMQLIYQDPYESLDPRLSVQAAVEEPLQILYGSVQPLGIRTQSLPGHPRHMIDALEKIAERVFRIIQYGRTHRDQVLAIALFATGAETDAVAAWRAFVPLAEAIGDQASLARAPARLRELAAPRSS